MDGEWSVKLNVPYHLFIGIDIAKSTISVVPLSEVIAKPKVWTIQQEPEDYKRLVNQMDKLGCPREETLVVMEATSTYWMQVAVFLLRAGYCVSVINPATAKYFMRTLLKRTKNDPADAYTLAQMGALHHSLLKLWHEPPPIYEQINQRFQHFLDLSKTAVQYQNRRKALAYRVDTIDSVLKSIDTLGGVIDRQLKTMKKEIHQLLKSDPDWGASYKRLTAINGIKTITAAALLIYTLNFTLCNTPEQAASYAGLVPHEYSSGESVRHPSRIGHAGNQQLRRLMLLAAWNSHRFVPDLQLIYDKHIQNGKTKQQASIAVARKMMHICWACVHYERDFDPNYQQKHKTKSVGLSD